MSKLRIIEAEEQVELARAQFLDTIGDLADRLEPRKILDEVWDTAKEKGVTIAGEAVDAVKRRPVATSGVLAAIGMFLAREPIKQGIVNIYDAMTSDEDETTEEAKAPAKPKPATKRTPRSTATTRKAAPRRTTKKATTT